MENKKDFLKGFIDWFNIQSKYQNLIDYPNEAIEDYLKIYNKKIYLKKGYDLYLDFYGLSYNGKESLAYKLKWVFITGKSIKSPHPYREYTLLEFEAKCIKNFNFYSKFLNNGK